MVAAVATTENGIVTEPTFLADQRIPRIERIPIGMLRVALAEPGPGYQRPPDMSRARKLAAKWDWTMLDPLVVSIRKDGPHAGEYFVVDGQHRYLAAAEIFPDTEELPALVLRLTVEEEARRFARQGENVRRVNARDLFRARIEARDPDALALRALVERQGWRIVASAHSAPNSNNDIIAVQRIVSIYNGYGPTILELTLKVLAEAYGHKSFAIDNRMLGGVSHFLFHFPVANVGELTERLSRPEGLPRRIYQASALYGTNGGGRSGGNTWVSRAILDVYNHGRRGSTRLDWDLKKYRETPNGRKRKTVAAALEA